jgi:dUTP pyrophosphatase
MILGRSEIIERSKHGLVGDLISDMQVQQAGVDLTVGKVFRLTGKGVLDFDNSRRELCKYEEIEPEDDHWDLKPGTYHCAMNETIEIPLDLCGLLLPRSSSLACGMEIHSALWDPGYKGRSFMHTVVTRDVTIYRNARIAQMVFMPVIGEASRYQGSYLDEDVLTHGARGTQTTLPGGSDSEG